MHLHLVTGPQEGGIEHAPGTLEELSSSEISSAKTPHFYPHKS